jgi:hypothetical protein
MEQKKLFSDLDFYPKGATYSVPPAGAEQTLKIEKVHGKIPVVRAIFADNLSTVRITIKKDGADTYVDNVALSVFRSDRPIPIRLPEGDYKVQLSRTDSGTDTVIANVAYLVELTK